MTFTIAQIQHMVSRFLGWRLPEDFNPDGGVSFDPAWNGELRYPLHWPTGTNVFDERQATAMVQHMLVGIGEANSVASGESKRSLAEVSAEIRDLTTRLNAVMSEAVATHEMRVDIDIDHTDLRDASTRDPIPRLTVEQYKRVG